ACASSWPRRCSSPRLVPRARRNEGTGGPDFAPRCRVALTVGVSSTAESRDVLVIGGGPAGAAVAMRAAAGGARVTVFEKGRPGRDKICGDGLTPRAVRALDALDVALDDAHRIDGLRMTANATVRQMDWPGIAPFPAHGAVWPRRRLDE